MKPSTPGITPTPAKLIVNAEGYDYLRRLMLAVRAHYRILNSANTWKLDPVQEKHLELADLAFPLVADANVPVDAASLVSRVTELEAGVSEMGKAWKADLLQWGVEQKERNERVNELEKALLDLHTLLDFDEPIQANEAQTFDDPSEINEAYAQAKRAMEGK